MTPPEETTPTLAEQGVDKKTANLARKLSALSMTDLNAVAARDKTLVEIRSEKIRKQRVSLSVPADLGALRPVPVVYADPPWQ